jgi:hypothetical protein
MRRFLRDNGLSLTVFGLFITFLLGQTVTGHLTYNADREDHGEPPLSYVEYLLSGANLEATAENWESEFLQMAMFVLFTAFLYQRGSAESKDPDKNEAVDRDPRQSRNKRDAPWPVRRGGWVLRLYENSLTIAFFLLFAISFTLHAAGGARKFNEEQMEHGGKTVTTLEYMGEPQFWFESFQNWQSEFLALGAMAVLSIFLRQRGSAESKPVDAAHSDTGKD